MCVLIKKEWFSNQFRVFAHCIESEQVGMDSVVVSLRHESQKFVEDICWDQVKVVYDGRRITTTSINSIRLPPRMNFFPENLLGRRVFWCDFTRKLKMKKKEIKKTYKVSLKKGMSEKQAEEIALEKYADDVKKYAEDKLQKTLDDIQKKSK